MVDDSHIDSLERWAKYVKENPKEFKKHLTPFLDSQIIKANQFYKRLSNLPGGKEKIKILRNKSIE